MFTWSAHSPWVEINIEGGPSFGVYSFKGYEELNTTYEFELELVSRNANEDISKMLGCQVLLTIADHSGLKRQVHGQIKKARQLHTANSFTHYQINLVPRFYFLGLNNNHRIFQNQSAPKIIENILKQQKFMADAYDFQLKETYEERIYCVQYNESDLAFISRLCEEEGIYFYFKHLEDKHILCFSDASGGEFIESFEGKGLTRFFAGSGQTADSATINQLNFNQEINSDSSTYREWNFEKPSLDLEVNEKEMDQEKSPAPGGLNLETYQFPHLYNLQAPGNNFANLQLKRQLTFTKWLEGEGNVSRLNPGQAFTLFEHPRFDLNDKWWLTKVEHFGEQPQVLEHEAPDRGFFYQSKFIAIPFETRFIPPILHPKQRIEGLQSAIVTGPKGEEIYVDEYGRVKVQFHWDREGEFNENTTCWMRVAQGWAGGQYGSLAIPRIGNEVIVEFMEGNPDRPLITGKVYHAENKVPYNLPEHKSRTVFKSLSTPGGDGFNELRVEDKKGEEEIYVHAEKDLNMYIKNNSKEHIFNDKHQLVENFSYKQIKGEDHQTVDSERKIELMADEHLTVHGNSHTEVKSKWLGKAGEEIHLKAGMKVVLEAGSDLTIKAGGQFIRLNPAGIFTSPNFNIGSGAAANGTGASPLLPNPADETEPGIVPKSANNIKPSILPRPQRCALYNASEANAPLVKIYEKQ